jgi:phosphatidylglycerol:prolipoprotein diacylglycerol transferase
MHPVLIELGRFSVYSYGFMLALSFFIGILIAGARAERRGISKEIIYDLSIVLILAAVIGSRTLYIITHHDRYDSIIDIIALWQGGATYYGGLVLAVAGACIFLRIKKVPFFRIADICAPSIALGVFITRIGCFLSGCCFGRPTESPLGLVFPPSCPAGHTFTGLHLHPTQLYASGAGLVIFITLTLLSRRKTFDGYIFGFFCIMYGAARFSVDFYRYYESYASSFIGHMTISQVLSVFLMLFGFLMLVILPRRARLG